MTANYTDADLEAYLDEALPHDEMAQIERAARDDASLIDRLGALNARRDSAMHSLASIWRANRLSCPTRAQLGSALLHALSPEEADYVRFHLEVVGCRVCQANWHDLSRAQSEGAEAASTRRRKYFESSAGYLKGKA